MSMAVAEESPRQGEMNLSDFDRDHAGVAAVAADTDGPAGADVTGGDVTAPQNAGAASEENNQTRIAGEEMEERQTAGEVDTQTDDLKPSGARPGDGLPPNPHGSEQGGGGADANAGDAEDEDPNAAQLEKTKAQLVQLAADFDNYKKAAVRRETENRERAVRGVLEEFLPVLDNFERAVEAAKTTRDIEAVRVGVEYILQQFQEALATHGVEAIETEGKEFDPLLHDALERVADSGQPSGTVVEQTQRGYTYRGQVLRPSRVKVAA